MIKYSNPRQFAEFTDWPLGKTRGRCEFFTERAKRGVRIGKQTTGRPKYTTFHADMRIVDGDDGKTYLIGKPIGYKFIKVARATDFCDQETVWPDGDNPIERERHAELSKLFEEIKSHD